MAKSAWGIAIAVIALAAVVIGFAMHTPEPKSVRIGYAISLSGVNQAGAGMTVLPNYRLWVKDVNAAGGILLRSIGKRVPIEVVEYDDESKVDKAVAAVDRLIKQDKVDFLMPPWGTGLNLAVGRLFHEAGYPHLAVTSMTDRAPELARLWPKSFWLLGMASEAAQALVETLATLRSDRQLGGRVAMVSVADQLGIEFAKAARVALARGGFEIVYDRAYSVGQQDMQALVEEAKQLNPDCFLAFSYPPDTLALTEQARASQFNPPVFYVGVGTAFSTYKQRFGADVEGVMGMGGWFPDTPDRRDFLKRHIEAFGQEPDSWASPMTYASLQMLQQAIERVGRIDRAAVAEELRTGTFDTILGPIKLEDNRYKNGWLVGQWQNGAYFGVAPATLPGARPVTFPKPAWRTAPTN
jgi:branched-chain amino acid transport system substrate-binding protein